ncbi:MAG: erythrose 4-phosphate dehydrogenase, partial [Mesorhizobium sp.]
EPVDHQVVAMIRESVDYWAPFIDAGRAHLRAK